MKILIIGATGFIGKHLVSELSGEFELMLVHRGIHESDLVTKGNSILTDRKNLTNHRAQFALFQPDIVIDLIAYFAQDAWDLINTFRQITQRVIVLSSGDVYKAYEVFRGANENIISGVLSETSPLRLNLFPYRDMDKENYLLEHYDKILVERILQSQIEFEFTILRLGALYGSHDSQRKLCSYIQPMLKNEKKISINHIKANWKWTRAYVKDIVNSIKLVIEKNEVAKNEIFNVGSQEQLTELGLLEKLKSLTGWNGEIELTKEISKGEELYNYKQHILLDTKKIRTKLQYQEFFTLEDGLKDAIDFERTYSNS